MEGSPEKAVTPAAEKSAPVEAKKEETPKPAAGASEGLPPLEEVIDIEDFRKVDIRVGTVLQAERVEKSDKLMRLHIEDGMGGRTILAGIARHLAPEDLVGKQVVFVANLKPRKMMGEMSQGMVLAASEGDKLFVLRPTGGIAPGTRVS